MTRWKLPDVLGGGEFDGVIADNGYVDLVVPEIAGYVRILRKDVTEVMPPLPDEPSPGVYTIGKATCLVYMPRASVLCVVGGKHSGWIAWQTAWERYGGPDVAIVPLVPAPEPVTLPAVELPWRGASLYSTNLRVTLGNSDPVNLTVGSELVALGREGASQMGYALLAAAAAKAATLPPPCGETWQDEQGCTPGRSAHLCELIGGHRTHRCVCGALVIEDGVA